MRDLRTYYEESPPEKSILEPQIVSGQQHLPKGRCAQVRQFLADCPISKKPSSLQYWAKHNSMRRFVDHPAEVHEMIWNRLHHLPPLGYDIDVHQWKFVVSQESSAVVRRAWQLIHKETSILRTLEILETEGYRTPMRGQTGGKPVVQATLYLMLRNPFYAGYIRIGDRLCKGIHEPLVSEEMFFDVQKLLDRRKRNWTNPRQRLDRTPLARSLNVDPTS